MNRSNVQRPGRGGFELLAQAKLKDIAASHVDGGSPGAEPTACAPC